jgi:galactitol-specific phosphotransferase system IIB component
MAEKRLILCVCGAGINTSINAEMTIQEHLQKRKLHKDYLVQHCTVDKMEPFIGRQNMVICWMTTIDEKFKAPGVQGLPYLIGGKKDKEALTDKIIELMNGAYVP